MKIRISIVVIGILLMLSPWVLADETTGTPGAPATAMSDATQTTTNMIDPAQPSAPLDAVVMTAQPVAQTNTPPAYTPPVPPAYTPPPSPVQPYYAPPPRKQTHGPFQHVKSFFKSLAGME